MITPKPKTVVELFEGHPERWCKDEPYRDQEGKPSSLEEARSFCLYGALYFIHNEECENYAKKLFKLVESVPRGNIFSWNDAPERTFEEVLAKCKELGI